MKTNEKIVYILGAGASKTAGLPIQSELLQLIYSIEEEYTSLDLNADILKMSIDENLQGIMKYYTLFDKYRRDLGKFILNNFSSKENVLKYESAVAKANEIPESDFSLTQKRNELFKNAYDMMKNISIALEDLFTIFDNVQLRHEHFKLYSNREIEQYNKELKMCVIYALVYATVKNANTETYQSFAKKLFEKRKQTPQKRDPFSVITMNWDSLLEHSINDICCSYNKNVTLKKQHILPDLCFFNNTLSNDNYIPFTHIKAKGIKNIKILKMHGSLNWLECPKCGRIFTDFNKGIANDEFNETDCPCCYNGSYEGASPKLQSLLITPTFLKSLESLVIKNIWHNAFIELTEAKRVVFIGYSFPDADFEMRCLLKKAIKPGIKIDVVLHSSDDPLFYKNQYIEHGFREIEADSLVSKMQLPEKRYKSFFGENEIEFYYNGFAEYVKNM